MADAPTGSQVPKVETEPATVGDEKKEETKEATSTGPVCIYYPGRLLDELLDDRN